MSDFDIEGESPMTVPEWDVPPQFKGLVPEYVGEDDDVDEGEEWSRTSGDVETDGRP